MKILVSGASGFIGRALVPFLVSRGHEVKTLVRKKWKVSDSALFWDPEMGDLTLKESFDAVINLSGESLQALRWTEAKKERILTSRILATKTLVNAVCQMQSLPGVFLNASGVGYYGSAHDKVLNEQSSSGTGFLAHVCYEWEAAAKPLLGLTRLVLARFGVVLAKQGGILKNVLLPFRLGFGGKIGSGDQWMSWIALDDLLNAILFTLEHNNLSGPVNFTSPEPVTNAVWTKTLGKALKRPAILPLPKFIVEALFGEMGDELLLSSTRALPEKLLGSGYHFLWPRLDAALQHLL